jgi:hypothetical protein
LNTVEAYDEALMLNARSQATEAMLRAELGTVYARAAQLCGVPGAVAHAQGRLRGALGLMRELTTEDPAAQCWPMRELASLQLRYGQADAAAAVAERALLLLLPAIRQQAHKALRGGKAQAHNPMPGAKGSKMALFRQIFAPENAYPDARVYFPFAVRPPSALEVAPSLCVLLGNTALEADDSERARMFFRLVLTMTEPADRLAKQVLKILAKTATSTQSQSSPQSVGTPHTARAPAGQDEELMWGARSENMRTETGGGSDDGSEEAREREREREREQRAVSAQSPSGLSRESSGCPGSPTAGTLDDRERVVFQTELQNAKAGRRMRMLRKSGGGGFLELSQLQQALSKVVSAGPTLSQMLAVLHRRRAQL